MNEESQGVMEEGIIAEENAIPKELVKPQAPQALPKKKKLLSESLRDWFYKLKAPKPISYVILSSFIIIIYTGLLLLSQKQAQKASKTTASSDFLTSPSPSVDPQVKSMRDKVNGFADYIDYINANTRKFTPPNIDLDINFAGKK